MTVLSRLLARLDKTDTCWIWKGYRHPFGYGNIRVGGVTKLTHRVSYELHTGPIPDGLHVLHRCDNPPCCNPDHLYVGTNDDNTRDRITRGRGATGSRCHPYKPVFGEMRANSRLKESDVVYIREQAALGVSSGELAEMFKIHAATISCIIRGKKWKAAGGPIRTKVLSRKEVGMRSAKRRWGFASSKEDMGL
jgi:hypothetical protein